MDGAYVYFAHSYAAPADAPGVALVATHGRDLLRGARAGTTCSRVQFHPEKSQRVGLALLERFVASLRTPCSSSLRSTSSAARWSASRRATSPRKTVYARRPAEKAAEFVARRRDAPPRGGPRRRAKAGWPVNLDAVRAICAGARGRGGARRRAPLARRPSRRCSRSGVRYVVLGTAAVERLDLVEQACAALPGAGPLRHRRAERRGEDRRLARGHRPRRRRGGAPGQGGRGPLVEYTDVGPRRHVHRRGRGRRGARCRPRPGLPVVASGGVASLADVDGLPRRRAGRRHRRQGALRGALRARRRGARRRGPA